MLPVHIKRLPKLSYFSLSLIFLAFQANAAPTISGVSEVGESKAEKGEIIRVQGSNFGRKEAGPAVLYDHGDIAWENGRLNDYH